MTEAAFPLFGVAFVMLVALPLSAVFAKAGLLLVERDEAGGPLHGLNARFLLLAASSAVPLAWFFSAALHLFEPGRSSLGCLLDHRAAARCFAPGIFALALALGVKVAWLSIAHATGRVRASTAVSARALTARIDRMIRETASLSGLRGRVVVTDDPGFTLGTRGLLRPSVFVGAGFAARLSDAMLASALGHEDQHVRSLDPLRYLLVELAMRVNPLGRILLGPHARRWRAAREAHCDREAVLLGAAPLPLADAIVRAARPTAAEAAALGAGDTAVLKLRIDMLLAFAERAPHRCCSEGRSAMPAVVALLLFALLLPHHTGAGMLDALHTSAERALATLWR